MNNVTVKGRSGTEYPMTAEMLKVVALLPDAKFEFDPQSVLHGELTGEIFSTNGVSLKIQVNGLAQMGQKAQLWLFVHASTPVSCPERLTDLVDYLKREAEQHDSDLKAMPDVAYYTEAAATEIDAEHMADDARDNRAGEGDENV